MLEISSVCACLCSCARSLVCTRVDVQQQQLWGGLEVGMGLVVP